MGAASERIGKLLDVRPGELRATLPALVLAFTCVGMQGLASIAADTIFVSTFSLGQLSRFFVVSALVRVGVTLGYGALARRFGGARFDAVVIGGASAVMLISGALARTHDPAVLYGVCIAQLVLPQLAPLIAFNAIMECFHARQGKRLLPLVGGAATVGTIAVAALAKFAAPSWGTPFLLVAGAVLGAFAVALPSRLARLASEASPRIGADPNATKSNAPSAIALLAEVARDLRSSRAVRVFVASALVVSMGTSFVDFAFKAALKAHYGRDEMAAFIGAVSLGLNAAVLIAQLVLSSRFVGRFGVRASLQTFPAALIVIGPALALVPGVATAAAAKIADGFLRYSIVGSVSNLLVTPLSADVRTRATVFVKGAAVPFGAAFAGVVLSAFGTAGPKTSTLGALLVFTGALGFLATWGARRAYMTALALALGEGRVSLDVSAEAAALLRSALTTILKSAIAAGDAPRARQVVALMGDRLFALADLTPALRCGALDVRRAAVATALRMARGGDGAALLELVPPDDDDGIEHDVLAGARALGALAPAARVDRALARAADGEATAATLRLWSEAMIARAQIDPDGMLPELRHRAKSAGPQRRAAALHAIAELREARASDEVMDALASTDAVVFAQAAHAAIAIASPGAIGLLVSHLVAGPRSAAAARALAGAGPSAIAELVAALPTTRGDGVARTAFASAQTMAGTVRAARVLSKLGPMACGVMLERFADVGHQARRSIARALAAAPAETRTTLSRAAVLDAMGLVLGYAQELTLAYASARAGLLRREIAHRIGECGEQALDLASALGGSDLVAKARAGLARDGRARGNALELLENALPPALAARTVTLLELDVATSTFVSSPMTSPMTSPTKAQSDLASSSTATSFDGWLAQCEKYDRGELCSTDPMLDVIEKLLVLSESSLFSGLSSEELYPVCAIAETVVLAPGRAAIRQGDPGDALFIVASGALSVARDGKTLGQVARGAVFGEVALLDGAPRSATVTATSDAQLLRIGRTDFEALLDEHPEIARGIIRTLLGHLRRA